MATIYLKSRIKRFFVDADGEVVFALYEDIDGDVHYGYLNRPHERDKMCACQFHKLFKQLLEDEQV